MEKKLNFIINLNELKYRTFYYIVAFFFTFIICFYYKVELFFLICSIFLEYKSGFIYTGLIEPFIIYFKISILFSIILTLPVYFYNFSFFFFKSFYKYNTMYFILYFYFFYAVSIIFYILSYLILFPIFLEFLFTFQRLNSLEILNLVLQATMSQYYYFFINYIWYVLLIILIPNLYLIIIFLKLINTEYFYNYKFRKYIYICSLFNFFLIAPPDFLIQLLFFPFVVILFEFLIYFISFFILLYLKFH